MGVSRRRSPLGGAYLHVYAQEPLPESSPLRAAPNTFLFPHASGCAPHYLDRFADEFVGRFERRYASAGRHC